MAITAQLSEKSTLEATLSKKQSLSAEVSGTSGGITDHRVLRFRDAADQHPISAITGLTEKLEEVSETVAFKTDETLTLKDGVLSVNTAQEPDPDNTLPITAAAVATTVGNIEILLETI